MQDTEFTVALVDGTACICHEVPSHCSASVSPGLPALPLAHASQNVGEEHETALNCSNWKSLGSGFCVACRLQVAPFHTAASVTFSKALSLKYPPTASQKRGDVHDTPVSCKPEESSDGTGNDCGVHCCPSHVWTMPAGKEPDW